MGQSVIISDKHGAIGHSIVRQIRIRAGIGPFQHGIAGKSIRNGNRRDLRPNRWHSQKETREKPGQKTCISWGVGLI